MKILIIVLSVMLTGNPTIYAQQNNHSLYNLTIVKMVRDGNIKSEKLIEIDSAGNIYADKKKIPQTVNVKTFSDELRRYVAEGRKVIKHPGNNDILFTGVSSSERNKQNIKISCMFLDDINKEKDLRNKTYYSWFKGPISKNVNYYSLYEYLNETEINILRGLLE